MCNRRVKAAIKAIHQIALIPIDESTLSKHSRKEFVSQVSLTNMFYIPLSAH